MQRLSNASVESIEYYNRVDIHTPRCGDGAPLCPHNHITLLELVSAMANSWTWLLGSYKIVVLRASTLQCVC